MFCPKCNAQYRPGFTECADCHVALVDTLPEQQPDMIAIVKPIANLTRLVTLSIEITVALGVLSMLLEFRFIRFCCFEHAVLHWLCFICITQSFLVQAAIVLVVTVFYIVFLLWIYRISRNLHCIAGEDMTYSPGWAIGSFFVPLANLVIPFLAVKEIWHVSHKDRSISHSPVTDWWALNIISTVLCWLILWRTHYCGESLTTWGMLVAHGLAVATLLARFNVVTRIASAYLTNCDAEGTARVEPVWASLIVGGTRIAAFLAKVKAATKIAAFLARVKAVTKMLCSLVTINISRAMILYTIGLAVVCVSLWTVIKPQMPLPVLYSVETNSPIFGADGRLTESVRLQTSNVSTVEIVPSGASSYDKTSLTIATVYNDQQSVRITLCRGNNARGSMNHQLGSFSITGISPFKAETTNIRILFLISSNTITDLEQLLFATCCNSMG